MSMHESGEKNEKTQNGWLNVNEFTMKNNRKENKKLAKALFKVLYLLFVI